MAMTSLGKERRNIVTSFSRLVLGAKQPVASHIRSQPRSRLELEKVHIIYTILFSYRIISWYYLGPFNSFSTADIDLYCLNNVNQRWPD